MKALDKVYVSIGPRQSLIAKAGKTLNSDIEYIRKELLLEWLKEQEEKLVSDSFTSSGKRKMLKRLIEKIESL